MSYASLFRSGRYATLGAFIGALFVSGLPACSSCRHPERVPVEVKADAAPAAAQAPAPSPAPAASCDTPANGAQTAAAAADKKAADEAAMKAEVARMRAEAEQQETARQAKRVEICKKLIADVLSGKPTPTKPIPLDEGHEFMPNPKLWKDFQRTSAICLAVSKDDPATCDSAADDRKEDCQIEQMRFHELRHAREANKWRYTDIDLAQCIHHAATAGKNKGLCEDYAAAVRQQDPSRCPTLNVEGLNECPALAALDPARCPSGKKHERCIESVERFKLMASGGLKALAEQGSPSDKQLARAALGDKEACDMLSQFVPLCANSDLNKKVTPEPDVGEKHLK